MEYSLCESIGKGCFATCYKAIGKANEIVAIKVIDLEKLSDYNVGCVQREIKILPELDHPNIIKFIDIYQIEYKVYIVTELYPMGNLSNYLRAQTLTESTALTIFLAIVKAVQYLHKLNICHRDIKLANIFLNFSDSETLSAVLGDFGFATGIHEGTYLTKVMGTPHYIAPEILEGKYGKSVDIWSLGVVLYLMITRNFPFKHTNRDTVKEVYANIRDINYRKYPFSLKVGKIISGIFVKNPEHRLTLEKIENLLNDA